MQQLQSTPWQVPSQASRLEEEEDMYFAYDAELEETDCSTAWTTIDHTTSAAAYETNSMSTTQNHSKAKLQHVETLLPDTGAVDNLI
eukprot:4571931-Amphidinium_carterae.1